MSDGHGMPPITCGTYIAAPVERVYEALTLGTEWNRWFTTAAVIEPVEGGSYQFDWKDFGPDRVNLSLKGPVLEAEPNESFVFKWGSGNQMTTVRFELEPRGPGTVVRVEETGYSADERDVIACLDCATGWGEALTLLKFYLEHGVSYGEVPPEDGEDG